MSALKNYSKSNKKNDSTIVTKKCKFVFVLTL